MRDFSEIIDAEKFFLGGIMLNPKAVYSMAGKVSPSDFYSERHFKIYSAMLEFAAKGIECDPFNLQSWFQERNEAYVCEKEYLFELAEKASSAGIEFHAEQIKAASSLRETWKFLEKSMSLIKNKAEAPESILEEIEKNYYLLKTRTSEKSYVRLSEAIDAKMEKLKSGKTNKGISTGFSHLDYYIEGMKPGQMITLAAPTGVGKTAFALNVAVNVAMQQKSVLFFSIEMETEDLLDRIICAKAGVNSKQMDNLFFDANDAGIIGRSLSELRELKICIDDTGNLNIAKIKARCQEKKMDRDGLDFIVIDYLQLIASDIENRTAAVTKISNSIKQMARELKIPILCIAQLNRDVFKDRQEPELHHLRDSGSIEQDSDQVWFITRKKKDGYEQTELKVAKNRKGPSGKFALEFVGENFLFREFNKVDSNGIVQSFGF